MTIGTLAALAFMIFNIGGFGEIVDIARESGKWSLFGNWSSERVGEISGPVIAMSFFVPTMLLLMGDANMYQRIFSAKDGGSAKKAIFFWIIGVIILESSVSFLGLTGSVAAEKGLMPDIVSENQALIINEASQAGQLPTKEAMLSARQAGSESVIPAIAKYGGLPLIIGLLLVSTMMAIIVSTADSFLLIPATNLTRDVYQRYINSGASERQIIFISRVLVLVLGLIAYLLVSQFKTVLNAAFTAYNIYGASLTPALLAAFLWKRATKEGAIASIITGSEYYYNMDLFFTRLEQIWRIASISSRINLSSCWFVYSSVNRCKYMTPAPPKSVYISFLMTVIIFN